MMPSSATLMEALIFWFRAPLQSIVLKFIAGLRPRRDSSIDKHLTDVSSKHFALIRVRLGKFDIEVIVAVRSCGIVDTASKGSDGH